jgi:hypothetical protein
MLFKNGLRKLLTGAAAAGLVVSAVAFAGIFYPAGATSVHAEKAPVTTEGGAAEAATFVPGEIVVVFAGNLAPAAIETLVEDVGGKVATISNENPLRVVVSVPVGEEEQYIDAYRQLGTVMTAEKNYVLSAEPESVSTKHKTTTGD